MKRQSYAMIPTRYGDLHICTYAVSPEEKMPHLALINPETDLTKTVNVRTHSECMTGDVFGSYRCECGEQLDCSMRYIAEKSGLIIYLRQEGRGIGLINKLHAYVKQDEGYDTAEANELLGFGYDDRTYEDAITILNDLGVRKINLLTNNPAKLNAFVNSNIQIIERIPLEIKPREQNYHYLLTKKQRFGHELPSFPLNFPTE